jgi:23S rRNA (uridine2552-2'-O)-methyltransferase
VLHGVGVQVPPGAPKIKVFKMSYKVRDAYTIKAQKEGFLARSAYKLLEIQKKHKILKSGQRILDLGCAPGSWTQATSEIIGPKGSIIGIDLTEVNLKLPNFTFFQNNILDMDFAILGTQGFHCVLSDMAPNTTGNKLSDQSRSLELATMAYQVAQDVLLPGGHFVAKIFMGPDQNELIREVQKKFVKVKNIRPESTRKTSTEFFLVAMSFKDSKFN